MIYFLNHCLVFNEVIFYDVKKCVQFVVSTINNFQLKRTFLTYPTSG